LGVKSKNCTVLFILAWKNWKKIKEKREFWHKTRF